MKQQAQPYRPHSVLVGGIARLGDAMVTPATPLTRTRKPTQPNKTMPNLCKPGRPAKPASAKKLPASEDYSTPYVPPALAVPVLPATPATAATPDALADIQIDDDVPLPPARGANGKKELAGLIIGKLKVGQSTRLRLDLRYSLQKVTQTAHKQTGKRFSIRPKYDDQATLRVWRVS